VIYLSFSEVHEEDIEDWYFNHQEDASFQDFVCKKRALKHKDSSCLVEDKKKNKNKKAKGETGRAKEEL
jgi:hypothetical protein